MFWNKKKEKDDSVADDTNVDNKGQEDKDTSSGPLHAMGEGDGMSQQLKDKYAEIRGKEDPGYKDVEVDDDGKPLNEEDAALLKGEAVAKDGDVSGGDAVNQGESEDSKSEPAGVDDSDDSYEEVELDPRLEAAGKSMGWSEDKIILIAETDMTILEDIATRLEESETHRQDTKDGKDGDTQEQSGLVDKEALTKLKEKLGDDAEGVLDILTKQVEAKFAGRFKEVDDLKEATAKESAQRVAVQRGTIADTVFDKYAEQFEEFGLTKDLPKGENGELRMDSPQMNVRAKVYEVATIFHQAKGGTFEQAMEEAYQHYAGGQRENQATRRVVKDLKENKKRFSPKPTGRKTVRVFKSTDAKASHIVQEARKKAGIEA